MNLVSTSAAQYLPLTWPSMNTTSAAKYTRKVNWLNTQVYNEGNFTYSVTSKKLDIEASLVSVPSTGLGVGKEGYRAVLPINPFNVTIPNGTDKTGVYMDEFGDIRTAPVFEACKGNRSLGYVIDRDFYFDWMNETCTPLNNPSQASTTKDGEGVEQSAVPTPSSQRTPKSKAGIPPPLPAGYRLVWGDEFDGDSLDVSKWEHEINCHGGGNNEEQCYVAHDDVLKVEGGLLTLQAHPAPEGYALVPTDKCNADPESVKQGACTNRKMVRSARIHTRGASWRYGRFEMKAKIPIGNFLWPAFWMLPATYKYGRWAASGEFDIMESRGQNPNEIGHALHYGAPWPDNVYSNLQYTQDDLSSDFMVYGMDWDQHSIKFYVNDRYTFQVETNRSWTSPTLKYPNPSPYHSPGQPWDQNFILLLNLAVGGNFFPGAKYDPNTDPATWKQAFIIDYIRVYQPTSEPYNQSCLHQVDDASYESNHYG